MKLILPNQTVEFGSRLLCVEAMMKGARSSGRTNGANNNEPVVYATAVEAVPVESTYGHANTQGSPTVVVSTAQGQAMPVQMAQGQAIPSEQAVCRGCRSMFYRDPRCNDCEADYYRCERCRANKGDAVTAIISDTCVVS